MDRQINGLDDTWLQVHVSVERDSIDMTLILVSKTEDCDGDCSGETFWNSPLTTGTPHL